MTIDRTDRELLLAHVLGKPRSFAVAHPEVSLDEHQSSMLASLIERRENGEPLSYITGTKEFYGREFLVTKETLIPRPATEALVESALKFLRGEEGKTHEIDNGISAYISRFHDTPVQAVLDVGTGSGCIAITLALEGVSLPIIGVDMSHAALIIARKNQMKFSVKNIQWIHQDGTNVVRNFHRPFLLVSNPPYIPEGTALEKTVQDFEPHTALFAGADGLNVIRPLLMAAKNNKNCAGVVVEMRNEQVKSSYGILAL